MSTILVHGRVLASDRMPIAGASVMFSRGPVPVPDVAQLTGSDGKFELSAPAPGKYRILVNAPGFSVREKTVDVVRGAAQDVEITVGDPDDTHHQ